jgi:tRNA A-37 threonylcarbamoyl transferase component Bud32
VSALNEPGDILSAPTHRPDNTDDAATVPPPEGARPGGAVERVAVAGYEVLEVLGRGGMGVVYKARQQSLRRIVALKMVLTGAHSSPEELLRFRIEAESVAQLRHPHVVQIYEVGQHDGCPYCAFEFIEGGNLAERIQGAPLTPEQAAQITEKLARAMQAAHDAGIVHRDLKPGNVLLTRDGDPKITDFGLAKRMDSELVQTRTGAVMGTPSYMAPEQAEGKRNVGPAADIYALGAILYELLTGRPPFQAETPLDTVLQVVSEEPVPPRRRQPKVPRKLQIICLKCLEKDPRRRYSSAAALGDDLRLFLRGEPIAARPPGPLGRCERWARLRPALAATFVGLTFFYVNHMLLLALGSADETWDFHWFVTGLVTTWAVGAVAFQWLVSRHRRSQVLIFAWTAFDVFMFTIFLLKGDGPRSAVLPGYQLLIAATALRFRLAQVWFVTGLCLASYVGLMFDASWRRPHLQAEVKSAIIFLLSLIILGLILHLVLRRVSATQAQEP